MINQVVRGGTNNPLSGTPVVIIPIASDLFLINHLLITVTHVIYKTPSPIPIKTPKYKNSSSLVSANPDSRRPIAHIKPPLNIIILGSYLSTSLPDMAREKARTNDLRA